MRARLSRAGLDAESDEVVAWLVKLAYLDDAAFARARAGALLAPGRLGPGLAERRIEAAGIPHATAHAAVGGALAEAEGHGGGEVALCRTLAERRTGGRALAALDERERARLARFLLGRGFSGSAIARVLGFQEEG